MSDYSNDISTSGPAEQQSFHVSDSFTNCTELPSKGYCRIVKAQRYGVWNVLKGLKPEYAFEKQYQEMISKEFSLMVGLNHPNIVRTYGQEQVPELGTCIVMEFIDGRTLSDFIAENPPAIQRRQVIFELLDAIAYFHKKQIVHQDLKPSNILITHDGNHVKIIDFGLSDSRAYAILKSPSYTKAYASPEQLAGGEIDNRTDIYAFGLILQKLFPHNYTQIIKKCLQPQRDKRYASSEILQEAIRKTDSVQKWFFIVIIASLILSGIIITLFYYLNNQEKEENGKLPEVVVIEQKNRNNTAEDSISAENNTVISHTSQGKPSADIIEYMDSQKQAQDLLDLYKHNLQFELDSISKPFDTEIKNGNITCSEIFHFRFQIMQAKMNLHTKRKRHQLPQSVQIPYELYSTELQSRYLIKYPHSDRNGNSLYESCDILYREGKIPKEEWEQINIEIKKEQEEIIRLSNLIKIEIDKD